MIENIILDIIHNYKHTKVISYSGDVERRDYFLFLLFCRLAELSNDKAIFNLNDYSLEEDLESFIEHLVKTVAKEPLNSAIRQAINNFINTPVRLSKKALSNSVFQSLSKSEKNRFNKGFEFQLASILATDKTPLLEKILPDIKHSLSTDNYKVIEEILSIKSLNCVESLSTLDAALIYSRVLLRLQATSHPLQADSKFFYQEIPSDFIDIILEIGAFDTVDSIYCPNEFTTEQSLYLALEFPDKEFRIESLGEMDRHIFRKFALAQVQNFITTKSHCLSTDSIIDKSHFDSSICLLQPKVVKSPSTGKSIEEGYSKKVVYKEHLYIKRMLESLNESGKGYVVTGKGPLFRKRDIEARQHLIENNLVDAIITLPAGILRFCPIPLVLTVLNKAKKTEDVLFINASEFQSEFGRRVVIDDIERLAEEYRMRPESSSFSFTIPNDKIINNNYSFHSLNYMKPELVQQLSLDTLDAVRSTLLNNLKAKEKTIIKLLKQ